MLCGSEQRVSGHWWWTTGEIQQNLQFETVVGLFVQGKVDRFCGGARFSTADLLQCFSSPAVLILVFLDEALKLRLGC